MNVRKMCFLSVLAVILIVQEFALSFIPNFQLTVLLIMVYGATIGFKYGSLIVLVHVLLDNLLSGSFTPVIIIPMLLGWEIILLLGSLLKNKNLIIKTFTASMGCIIYCMIFAIANVIVYEVNLKDYLLADLLFQALFVLSTAMTMLLLYDVFYRLVGSKWKELCY